MIDRAVWRELAAMLYERAEDPAEARSDRNSILFADEAEDSSETPVRMSYEALLPRLSAF